MIATAQNTARQTTTLTSVPTPRVDLRKRALDGSTCGWLGGRPDLPALCAGASSCVRDTEHKYVGCCATMGSCTAGIYTSCVDQNSPGWSPPPSVQTNGVFTCLKNEECYRNTYDEGYYQFGCGKSSWATRVETTFTGQPSDVTLQLVYTAVTFPVTTNLPSESSMITSETPMISTPVGSLPSSSARPHQSDKPDPGAVAGIVIGVVNVCVILAGLALCLCLRKRRQRIHSAEVSRNSSRGQTAVANASPMQRFTGVSHIPNIIPTPLRISPSLASYRSPHVARPSIHTSPTSSKFSSQRAPLVGSNFERQEYNRYMSEVAEASVMRAKLSPRPEPQPIIGAAVSTNLQGLRRPANYQPAPIHEQELGHNIDDDDNDDDMTLEYHSVTGNLTDSSHSRGSRPEDDLTSSVSLMSDQDDSLGTASIRQMTHVRRGNSGRYHLVDQMINDEPSTFSRDQTNTHEHL